MKKYFFLTAYYIVFAIALKAQQRIIFSPKLDAKAVDLLLDKDTAGSLKLVNAYMTLADVTAKHRLRQQYGVHFNVCCGQTYTIVTPKSSLTALATDSAVKSILVGESVQPMMDEVRRQTHVDALQAATYLPMSYRGKGVLIGVIDTGFDYTHPNFVDDTGHCRILSVWDQNSTAAPSGTYGYGRIYDTPAAITAVAHDNAITTHGTHVAGIAAGSAATPFRGIAPEADLVLVSTNQTEQGIIDGVDYLLQYAQRVGRPIVINLSLGTMMGFKDGTGLMSHMVDHLLAGKQGCLMSVAVGNEGNRKSTLVGRAVKSVWKVPSSGADQLFVESRPGDSCSVRLLLKDKQTNQVYFDHLFSTGKVWTEHYSHFGTADSLRASLTVACVRNDNTGAYALTFHVGYSLTPLEEWVLELNAKHNNAFVYSNNGYFATEGHEAYSEGSNASTIAMTATGKEPIAVGAIVSKNRYSSLWGVESITPWTLYEHYPLSALGPCSDGRIKPDIVAPGASVVSSYNSFAAPRMVKKSEVVYTQKVGEKNYYWYVENGTSMAAPVVAGIMALWLQANPSLTVADVRNLLAKTAIKKTFMGETANNEYGMGQIDALAGMLDLLNATSIMSHSSNSSVNYAYDPASGMFRTQGVSQTLIYGTDGRLLHRSSDNALNLSSLSAGLYLIRLVGKQDEQTVKLCILK